VAEVIYPPRPRGRINPASLSLYELTGDWVAQRKFGDTRTLLHIEPGLVVSAWSRRRGSLEPLALPEGVQKEIRENLRSDGNLEYWIDGGVMNGHKDVGCHMVFWDVLQAGRYFYLGPDQMTRLKMLADICGNPAQVDTNGIALLISQHLCMAETFERNFVKRFEEAYNDDRLEGLVLRRKSSTLDNPGKGYYEVNWLMRCRKPTSGFTKHMAALAGATGNLLLRLKPQRARHETIGDFSFGDPTPHLEKVCIERLAPLQRSNIT